MSSNPKSLDIEINLLIHTIYTDSIQEISRDSNPITSVMALLNG